MHNRMQLIMENWDENDPSMEPYFWWFPWLGRFTTLQQEYEFVLYLHETVNTNKRTVTLLVIILMTYSVAYIIFLSTESDTSPRNLVTESHHLWNIIYFLTTTGLTGVLHRMEALPRHVLYEGMFFSHMCAATAFSSYWHGGDYSNIQSDFLPAHALIYYFFSLAVVPRAIVAAIFGLCLVISSLVWTLLVSSDVGSAFVLVTANLLHVTLLLMLCGELERTFRISFLRKKGAFENEKKLAEQRALTDNLLKNILPVTIVDRLGANKLELGNVFERFPMACVLFADIVNFTQWSSSLDPERVGTILHRLTSLLDDCCFQLRCEKIKTVGDAYWVVSGVPDTTPQDTMFYRISEFALSIPRFMARVNDHYTTTLQQRIGVHCGPITAGIIGKTKFSYDVWGATMNRCIVLESTGVGNKVHVSSEFKNTLDSTINAAAMFRCIDSHLKQENEREGEKTYFLVDNKSTTLFFFKVPYFFKFGSILTSRSWREQKIQTIFRTI